MIPSDAEVMHANQTKSKFEVREALTLPGGKAHLQCTKSVEITVVTLLEAKL